jgi:ATP-dependent helicase/nuclease subunit A
MIEKIIRLIQSGVNVGEILAVTFTKKAASQMKEKLRKALIKTINDKSTSPERRAALKKQLDEVPSADISTIHSFCSKLIRSHFYVAGVDNDFRVINGEDAEGTAMKNSAIDELFEEGYEEQGENFQHLLSVYWRKKSDNNLRKILLETYEVLRNRADYKEYLSHSGAYDEHTFDSVCIDLFELLKNKCRYYLQYLETERAYFDEHGGKAQLALSAELEEALTAIIDADGYFAACVLRIADGNERLVAG